MNFPVAFSSRLFVLLFLPFQTPTSNSVYLSFLLLVVALLLSLGVNKEGFSWVHHHLKHPESFSLGLILSSVLVGVGNYLYFALGLCLLVTIVYFSSLAENKRNKKILGLRYELYDRWVSDFLPGVFPVAKLPTLAHFSLNDRMRRAEGTLIVNAFLVLCIGILSLYRPFHSQVFTSLLWIASLLLFVDRFPLKTWRQSFEGIGFKLGR